MGAKRRVVFFVAKKTIGRSRGEGGVRVEGVYFWGIRHRLSISPGKDSSRESAHESRRSNTKVELRVGGWGACDLLVRQSY